MTTPVFVIDDDDAVLSALTLLFGRSGYEVRPFSSAKDYLTVAPSLPAGVLVTDVRMPEIDGLELMRRRRDTGIAGGPVIVISGHADVPMAVEAMRLGARDLIEKPFSPEELLAAVREAADSMTAPVDVFGLTTRERQVADALAHGATSKEIARDLGLSHRTIEVFRARLLKKTGAANTAALVSLLGGQG